MTDPTIRATGEPVVGATTTQGDPLTVTIGQTLPGGRRHVAIRWPYAAAYALDLTSADELDGIDVTSGEALALGVLLVRAHDRIQRGDHTTATVARQGEVMIGRVRLNEPGSGDVIGVRIARNPGGAAAVGVHYHRGGLDQDAPRVMWLPLRDARVLAGVLDVVGADRAAALVRRAVVLATDPTAVNDEEDDR